jgi:hypothetical protein
MQHINKINNQRHQDITSYHKTSQKNELIKENKRESPVSSVDPTHG